jgi:hypothetical protein
MLVVPFWRSVIVPVLESLIQGIESLVQLEEEMTEAGMNELRRGSPQGPKIHPWCSCV